MVDVSDIVELIREKGLIILAVLLGILIYVVVNEIVLK